jgi:ATP-dependent DNA ligase
MGLDYRILFTTLPELFAAIGRALPGKLVLDGEIIYLGNDGCSRFYDLMRRRAPLYFYAFDLCGRMARICGGCR